MLRPCGGNDFVYSDREMDVIRTDMALFREHGANGFVFGALNADRTINEQQCSVVLAAAKPLPVTFHRAFDVTLASEMVANAKRIECMGFTRLLTSGLRSTAECGQDNIRVLNEQTESLIIVAGAGIHVANAASILANTRCKEFHASASKTSGGADMTDFDFGRRRITDVDIVRELVRVACGKESV